VKKKMPEEKTETETETETEVKEVKKRMPREENSVFVGRRPTMNYVMATMMILNKGEDCTVKARGRAISHAVDVCEILRNRFLKGTEYKGITLSTEQLEGENGQTNNVSSIEIVLAPPK
jgi:DNA-binding protein